MGVRNEHVTKRLTNQYRDQVPNGLLNVHCVSNKEYWDHRDEPRDMAEPYLRLSGIPRLRRHCIGILADSQLRSARAYIRDDIPALLSDLDLWIISGAGSASAERRRVVREALDVLQTTLQDVSQGLGAPCIRN
jgi:hypothetical protein